MKNTTQETQLINYKLEGNDNIVCEGPECKLLELDRMVREACQGN